MNINFPRWLWILIVIVVLIFILNLLGIFKVHGSAGF